MMMAVGAECSSPVPSGVDRRSIRTWSAVDKATETEQEDTENDDVPLAGLLQCGRREVDDAQVLLRQHLACCQDGVCQTVCSVRL